MDKDTGQNISIYAVKNKSDGKSYIGQTKHDLQWRFARHACRSNNCKALREAILNKGKDNFEVVLLETVASIEEADEKERFWIKEFNADDARFGYNSTTGGHTWEFSEKVRKEMSENRQGKNNSFYNKHHSDEQREKWSKERKGLYEGGKHPQAKRVKCVETGKVYDCIKDASADTGANKTHLAEVCRGVYGRKTAKGLHWVYEQ